MNQKLKETYSNRKLIDQIRIQKIKNEQYKFIKHLGKKNHKLIFK